MNTRLNRLNTMRQRRHKKPDPAMKYLSLKECFDAIIEHSKHSTALNYCVNYAKYGLELLQKEVDPDSAVDYDRAMYAQCLYVLNNMTHWRGETATNVRANLRDHMKALEQWEKGH
jgi:hypothetical protein